MIFAGLKRKTLQYFFDKKRQEKENHYRESGNTKNQEIKPHKITKIGVLLNDKIEGPSVVNNLVKVFGFDKKQITFLVHKPQLDVKKEANSEGMFGNADFGWYGSIKNPLVKDFVQSDFDLLINYSAKSNLYIDVLVLLSKASFKVSHAGNKDDLYDLVVATGLKDVSTLNEEAKKYLQILKKI
ncbi:MAG: hypothetical protein COB60_02595 [Flavobacteriaceae bacterium]|nr:MAG: hypothetical protein COB60_02595 [Flavobacteriaceae bacterium]